MMGRSGDPAGEAAGGGEVVNTRPSGLHKQTQMVHLPGEGYGRAAYFRNVQVFDWEPHPHRRPPPHCRPPVMLRCRRRPRRRLGEIGGREAPSRAATGRRGGGRRAKWGGTRRRGVDGDQEACGDQEAVKGWEAAGCGGREVGDRVWGTT
ncbi:hypothetical protein GUJ93_ZPchr0010g9459 [Zizania palustris]|uniref:Neprosin PEP catalytic domain-containing protein n=1 Tax=Zizania palustris TaxID=103762 RepID=A0A8J5TDU1_ZIZPA|nr:hypothetical protein GUJ93_ZPchr0010g9459 [Zizania palustris]